MKTFEKARTGDRVYCLRSGYGKITNINTQDDYPIRVEYDCEGHETFTLDGKYQADDDTPMLYWDKPKIIVPDAPKRLVKKTVERYANIYYTSAEVLGHLLDTNIIMTTLQHHKGDCNVLSTKGRLGVAKVTIEYEIEE